MSGRAGSAFRGKNFGYPYCQRIKHKKVQRARLNWRALRLMRIRINRHPSERTAPRSRAPKWFPLRAAGTRAVIRPLGAHSLAFVVGAVGQEYHQSEPVYDMTYELLDTQDVKDCSPPTVEETQESSTSDQDFKK
ncbi:unnamed protein product [Pieris brassicae]|uniref:Uncharacterized protein n=1 Tax=Pieris brassicae TaxID=7116 RepID=A0A9P0X934_PIEBR|nr:unnamed protein product [Pieris brassicae]